VNELVLVRHAIAASNHHGTASSSAPGEGLTPAGQEQARRLGRDLAREAFDLGVATELRRTQETLDLALEGRDVPRLIVPELNEIRFGSFDGGPLVEYRAWAGSSPPSLEAPGGGESRAQAAARVARGLHVLLERPERRLLAVGHALAIRYILDAAQRLAPAPLMSPIDHAAPHHLTHADVTAAASVLEEWSRAPRFRDHSREGRAAG
jgi:broad specificity phosphatase PhoE